MPVGKNSIKRVKNGGYSNVKTSAPDMENSTVIANISPEVVEKMISPLKEKTETAENSTKKVEKVKKSAPVSKKQSTEKKSTKAQNVNKNIQKEAKEVVSEKEDAGFVRFGLGDNLPSYLL